MCHLLDPIQWTITLPFRGGMVKYCNCIASFFRNISKTAETILIKKIEQSHGISVYKKALISQHQKNYIFRDNKCFVKMYMR